MQNFSKLASQRLESELARRGSTSAPSAFRRALPADVVHGILFDNRGRAPSRFRVMLFVNAPEIDGDQAGGYLVRYFTGGSLSETPRELPCDDADRLRVVLDRLLSAMDPVIEPFFAAVETPAALARSLRDDPKLDFYRAQLYALDGQSDAARTECDAHLHGMTSSLGPGHPELLQVNDLVRSIRNRIGGTDRTP